MLVQEKVQEMVQEKVQEMVQEMENRILCMHWMPLGNYHSCKLCLDNRGKPLPEDTDYLQRRIGNRYSMRRKDMLRVLLLHKPRARVLDTTLSIFKVYFN